MSKLIVITGATGIELNAIGNSLESSSDLEKVHPLCTTKKREKDEKHGREFMFLTKTEFEKNRGICLYELEGERYGFTESSVLEIMVMGKTPFIIVNLNQAKVIKEKIGVNIEVIGIFKSRLEYGETLIKLNYSDEKIVELMNEADFNKSNFVDKSIEISDDTMMIYEVEKYLGLENTKDVKKVKNTKIQAVVVDKISGVKETKEVSGRSLAEIEKKLPSDEELDVLSTLKLYFNPDLVEEKKGLINTSKFLKNTYLDTVGEVYEIFLKYFKQGVGLNVICSDDSGVAEI